MAIIKMTYSVADEVAQALPLLEQGQGAAENLESEHLDLKEEAGSRNKLGERVSIGPNSEDVAKQLAREAACFANTPGGGALIVGVSDDGTLVGAQTDASWLRHRIFQLTRRAVTPVVSEYLINDVRVLVIEIAESVERVLWQGKSYWRVGPNCEVVDPTAWVARHHAALNVDWSGLDSGTPATDARPPALHIVRSWLTNHGDDARAELAACDDATLLSRLGASTGHGTLTNAGHLLFVGRNEPALDYMRRDYDGGDSLARVNLRGVSLAEELDRIFITIEAYSPRQHIMRGLSAGQFHDIPLHAAREAVINGVAHREWASPEATVVEHVGSRCTVTSPGGFFGTVTEDNVLTHPSHSRNRALTLLLAKVGVAEQEGIGVDRMTASMVRYGHQPPIIKELDGPTVRTTLLGGTAHAGWVTWLADLSPHAASRNVSHLLILRHLAHTRWIDARIAAGLTQLDEAASNEQLVALAHVTHGDEPILQRVEGVPPSDAPAWAFTESAWLALDERGLPQVGQTRPSRSYVAHTYAEVRGRISSTELASILGASATNVGDILKQLAQEGILRGSSPNGRGRGFHYVHVAE